MTDVRAAAEALVASTIAIAEAGIPLMHRVVDPAAPVEIWAHYPADDAVDSAQGYRWFYHAHPPGEREADEHGHFHLFAERSRLLAQPGVRPLAGPLDPDADAAAVVHLVAIAIDMAGLPTRLFTVNRWVTDEWIHGAADLRLSLDGLDFSRATAGDALVNRWLGDCVRFFRPVIDELLAQRDAAIAGWESPALGFEDRALEILSEAPIRIDDALSA